MQAPSAHVVNGKPSPDMLAHALEYLGWHWSVIPVCSPVRMGCMEHGPHCVSPGKTPLVKWAPYRKVLPTEAELRTWWTQWPRANIALITGELSGVVVLDLDNIMAVNEALSRGIPAGTPWASTGRTGGRHYFFAYTPEAPRNFTKQMGMDFRGEGGYAIVPPSLHSAGPHYNWQDRP